MLLIAEALKFANKLQDRKSTDYILLHHSAGAGSVQDIHKMHLLRNFSGIGYHFYVRLDGSTYTGRPLAKQGAACDAKKMNQKAIHVCAEGNMETGFMPPEQKAAIVDLIHYLWMRYPRAKAAKHSDMEPTACPGKNYPFEEIKANALAMERYTIPVPIPQIEGYSRISNTLYRDILGKIWKPAGVLKLALAKGLKIWR
jgi:N-acetylmuramoyl-L-alanine amidase